MVRIVFRDDAGTVTAIEATPGRSLMENAKAAGIAGIEAECGGSMVCGTCSVYLAPDWFDRVAPASAMEAEMLEYICHPRPTSRLACQIMVTPELDGLEVTTPPSQR